MPATFGVFLRAVSIFLVLTLSAEAATVNAIWNSATDVPLSASSYTATGNSVNFTLNYAPATGTNLTVLNNTGLPFTSGTFDNLAQGQAVDLSYGGVTYNFVANYYGGTGNDLTLVWANNRAFAWGSNGVGQLGDGTLTNRVLPAPVATAGVLAGKTVIALAGGYGHMLALCSDGTLAAWGNNGTGELGINTSDTYSSVPVAVNTANGTSALYGKTVVAIDAGSSYCLALCSDGTVAAWGSNNFAALGTGGGSTPTPVAVNTTSGISALYGKTVVAIDAGNDHALALCSDGTVVAWGNNEYGAVGNNSTATAWSPVAVNVVNGVSALYGKSVIDVTAGDGFSMALCSDGSVVAWGNNYYGELGNTTTTNSLVPVAVNTASGTSVLFGKTVTALSAGRLHALALCSDGTLAAWGYNYDGALGNGAWGISAVPAPVAVNVASGTSALYGKTVRTITAGDDFSAAVCTDGTCAAWGYNLFGRLGDGTTATRKVPVNVIPNNFATGEVFAGLFSGQPPNSVMCVVATPVQASAVTLAATGVDATSATLNGVDVAAHDSVALSFDYGLTTAYGTTVAGTPATATGGGATPSVASLTGLVPGATYHFRFKGAGGSGALYGADQSFTTPYNDARLASLALSIGSLSPAFSSSTTTYSAVLPSTASSVQITPGAANNTAVVRVNGAIVASGASRTVSLVYGDNAISVVVTAQDGTTVQTYSVILTRSTPNPLGADYASGSTVPLTIKDFTATGSTVNFSLSYAPAVGGSLTVVNNSGVGFIQGAFDNLAQGQLVTMSFNGMTYKYVANYYGGTGNDLVLQWAGNRAFATGYNNSGQLGIGSYTSSNVPVPVTATGVLAGKTIAALAAGAYHSLALCSDGTLAAWGDNNSGKLGNNSATSSSTLPVAVDKTSGLSSLYGKTVVAIAAGSSHSMALCSDGTVSVWGSNASGQLGNNGSSNSSVPVAVSTTSGVSALYGKTVVAIAAGDSHCLALCSDGTLAAWGGNDNGQIGNNNSTTSFYNIPVAVNTDNGVSILYGKTVRTIAAGGAHNLVLCTDGSMAAWGSNISGQSGSVYTGQKLYHPVWVQNNYGTGLYAKTVVAVSAGSAHSMALCSDGTVAAWGNNYYGQLGINSTTTSTIPVAINTASGVSGLYGKTVVAITAGNYHSWVLCSDGTAAAWGYNNRGQLGINSTTSSSVPVAVNRTQLFGGESLMNVSVGPVSSHMLAMVADPSPSLITQAAGMIGSTGATLNGTVNAHDGTAVAVSFDYGTTTAYGSSVTASPASVTGGSDTAVSAALTGLAPSTTYHFRVNAAGFPGTDQTFTTLSNDATLASLTSSTGELSPAFASGTFSYTAPGVGDSTNSVTVTPTLADSNASVAVNGVSATSGGAAPVSLGYGLNIINVQVTAQDGVTKQTYILSITRAAPITISASYASGSDVPLTTNGYTATGKIIGLALNYAPATGTNLTVVNNTGVPFISGTFDNLAQGQAVLLSYNGVTYKFVANYYGGTGNDLVLAWAANRAFAWGDNSTAQIGDGTATQRNVMVPVSATGVLAGKTILALSQGRGHSLGLCSDGTLAAWGTNYYGTLGNGNNTSINFPVTVNTASGVSALYGRTVVGVSAGTYFSLAVCSDGSVVSWGYNPYGQLGNNGTTNTNAPVLVNTTSGTSALYGKTVVAVSAGAYHSVALCSDGTVAAWGYNNTGQLGNNTTTNSTVPVAVNTTNGISALYGKTVVAISAGDQHTMALCSDGTVVAWGDNIFGDLGNNSGVQMKVPVAVNATNGVSALYGKTVVGIAAGNWLSLALCTDGTVAAWGYNNAGQLGNNTTTNSSVPLQVSTASGTSALYGKTVVGIAAVGSSCTAFCTDGTVATWGYNYYGQLGNNTTNNSLVPQLALTTPLNAGERVINPSQVANDGQSLVLVAEPVPTVTTLAATAVGSANATLNGTVNPNNGIAVAVSFAYGTTTAYGSSVTATPGSVTGGSDTAVSAALSGLAPSTTYHFRVNAAGFPGTDQTFTTLSNDATLASLTSSTGELSPAFASGTTSYTTPAAGSGTTFVTCTPTVSESHATVTVNGIAVTSGSTSGPISLGFGTTVINVQVTAQDGVTKQTYTIAVPGSTSATFAAATDVPVSANGFSAAGSTVDFTLNYAPVTGASLRVVNNTGLGFISGTFSNLSQGQAVTLVYNGVQYNYVANYYGGTGNDLVLVWAGNRALGWGDNLNALLGDGTSTSRLVPTPVTATGVLAGKVVVATSAGYSHGLALCSDGTVAAWGGNWYGQLGDNTYNSRATPVAVNTASGVSALYGKTVVAIGAGYEWSMALCSDGTVVSWGYNSIGQLGDGSTTNRVAPVAVSRGSGVSALYGKSVVGIAAGASHSLALCSDGAVVAWGSNASGQLGNNSTNNSAVPVLVSSASGVSSLYGKTPQMLAAGVSFSVALCSDGSLASWGTNASGQLGDNTLNNRSVPGAVNAVNGTSALYGRTPAVIAAGYNHTMALCTDGTLLAWGSNAFGQLGDNSTTNRPAAVAVNAASGSSALYGRKVVGLTCGSSISAAFCSDGSIATWGANSVGQLGNNTTSNSSVPVDVSTSTLSPGERFASVGTGIYSSAMFATAAAPPAAPAAATLAATSITTTGATLNGTANASGNTTTVSFEFGPTTSYGTTVAATPATLTDSSTTAVAASLTGLTPGTTYHFRVKAVSGAGTANGSDQTFTTISTNANLTGLALNNGTLSPVFAGGTTSYTATVAYPVTSITLRPTLANAGASVMVNGLPVSSGSASAPVSLSVGDNTLTTVVTAQDGTTTQTYTVTVTRAAPSTNARLASLTPSVGILSPAFDSSVTSYTVTVPFGTTSMTLTPTVADSTSSVQVNGTHVNSGSASGPLAVDVGSNFFSVVVTAQDGVSTQTYSITVVRPALPAVWSTLSDVPLVTTGFTATGNTLGALTLNFAPATGTNLMVVKNTGLGFISGTFSNLSQGQAVAIVYNGVTYNFVANYYGGTGNDLVLQWAGNRALAWGYNGDGELGDGTTTQRNTAVSVTATGVLAGKTILSLAMGAKHSLALCSDGTLAAWGANTSGQLGDNTTTDRLAPVMVNNSIGVSALYGKTVIAIAAGQSHSLALCSDGTVVAWGENLYYQLGDTTTTQRNAPVQVNSSSGISALFGKTVVAVAAGARHNLALCSDGSVAAWGANTSGQLGDNTTSPRSAAVAVNASSGLSALNGRSVVAVAAGGLHSLALCTDGAVLAWGNDVNGELGDDNAAQFYTNSPVAVLVNASSGSALFGKSVVSIMAGYAHSLAQCSDGTLAAWGSNAFGQLGDTTTNNGYVPVTVSTASGVSALNGKTVSAISAGARHSMAQCTDGTLTAWGMATSGQLGNNSTTSSSAPVAVSATPLAAGEVFVRAASGPYALHSLAVIAAPTPPPTVSTLAATGVGSTSAYLNATVNANNSITTVSFDYGTTTAYGSSAGDGYLGAVGTSNTSITAQLIGLAPATTYHFRVKGSSGAGSSTGSDLTFTTLNNNAGLAALVLNNGTLTPAFATGTTNYTASVPYSVSSITLRPTLADANATVKVNGQSVASGSASTPIALNVGDNALTTVVTAQDGTTTQTYTVVVTRAALSTNATLAALTSNIGAFTPAFDSGTISYTATVPFSTTSLTLTPTVADSTATLKINGVSVASGSASTPLTLNLGNTVFNVVVTAQDEMTTQTYSLTVTRQTALAASFNAATDVPFSTNGMTATGSTVNFTLNFAPPTGTNLTVVNNTGLPFISGTFDNLAQGQAVELSYGGVTYNYVAHYYGGTGNDLVLVWASQRAFAWGSNPYGDVGDGTTTARKIMVPVTTTGVLAGKTIVSLQNNSAISLALCSDGTLAAWGSNYNGHLGNGTTTDSLVPVLVSTASGSALHGKTVVAIAAGGCCMALCSDGTVATWGYNEYGNLGNNSNVQSNVPVKVNASYGTSALYGKTVVAIAAGAFNCMALCSDGTLTSWGLNNGQLGNNAWTDAWVPVQVSAESGVSSLYGKTVSAIAVGSYFSMALCTDGTVSAWGDNYYGQLGTNRTTLRSLVPVLVNTTSGVSALYNKTVVAVAAGYSHALGLCSDGTVAAWGSNYFGQLGDNSTTQKNVPVLVNTTSGTSALYGKTVQAITTGGNNSLTSRALCTDGTLAAWGGNTFSFLGNNSTTDSSVPVKVITTPLAVGERIVNPASGSYAALVATLVAEPPPTLTTQAASAVGSTTVVLNGTANPNGGAVAAFFDYGTTTAYGSSITAAPSLVSGGSTTAVSAALGGLAPLTTYHFRIKGGTYLGGDQTFTTLNNDATLSGLTVSSGTLSPAFACGTLAYAVVLDRSATSISLTPTANDGSASITVNGLVVASGSASGAIALFPGSNTVTTVVTAQDGVTKTTYVLNVACLSTVQNWRQQNFGTAANTGPTADTADYDGDGICNLLEYALNLSPTAASKLPVTTAANGANFEYTYTRSTAAVNAGTIFTVEWNATLSAASWSSSGVTQTVLSDDGTTQQVKAVIPMNGASTMFVHLSATAPP